MATDPLIGTTVGGCEILEVIGQGGMGVIYRARQKSLDRVVALKVLARHLANDVNFVTRFQKEARAIAKVNHPNILAVYDVGDDQHTNYMIMELIDGRSLAELQNERHGAIPWEEAADYVRQAAQGLEAAQAVGIIHRDIKPENLMVTKKGVIKVSDFGLAKEADASSGATSVDAVMGTPAFMSPEQCDGKKVDGRSDIYSLGGTFYRLITGRLPFEAETAMSMMYRHKHEALIPPHEIVNTVPPAISAVIVKMMAKKREQRCQTMTEVIDGLDAARRPQPPKFAAPAMPGPADAVLSPPPSAAAFPIGGAEGAAQAASAAAHDTPTSTGLPAHPPAGSARMAAMPGPGGGFAPSSDSSARLSMSSGVMGIAPSGLGAPDEGYTNVARGDEMTGRGDRIAGLRCYRQALQSPALDQATRARIEQEIRKEISTRRQAVDGMLKRSMLVEASRECRVLVELDPADEVSRSLLKDLDAKLSAKRTLVNDIRTSIAASSFEKAIKAWDGAPAELRDESLGKQIEQLRSVVVPSLKLAEQGETFSRQGRLEEAMSSFEDALKIHPACEPARQGQKDTEQKLQRIEYMLKEGFQHSLEQDYAKAIDTYKPILELRPGHAQAAKGIVDAYIAYAQHLRAHGDLDGALAAYQGAAETDKQNRTARKMLEEVTNLRDKEQALIDRAQDAAARNHLSAAIGYWREVLRVNPSSKRAAQQIQALGGQRSRVFVKALAVLAVLGVIGAAAYQYYTEMRVLAAAQTKLQRKEYADVARLLGSARILIFKNDREQLIKEAGLELRIEEADALAAAGKLPEAARALEDLAKQLAVSGDKPRAAKLTLQALEWNTQYAVDQAKAALREGKWADASRQFEEVRASSQDNALFSPRLQELRLLADKASVLALKVLTAGRPNLKDEPARQVAELKDAQKLAEELQMPEVVELVKKELADRNFDPDKFKALVEDAKRKLAKTPPDYAEARRLFLEALKYNPDPAVKQFLDYLDAVDYCAGAGMSLVAARNPLRGGAWGGDERRAAFCIDRYEWPNTKDALPRGNVTWVEARKLCQDAGKKLCTSGEWEDACRADGMFFYGNEPDPAACNTGGSAAGVSGSKPKCRNSLGVYDMSGNLAEWTDRDGDAELRGGAYDTPARQASCIDVQPQDKAAASPRVGFRCCRRLPETLPAKP